NGRKGILPQSRVDVLLPDPFGDGSLRARWAAALERRLLLRHEVRSGGDEQDPDEAVASEVRELGVLCHRDAPSQQRGFRIRVWVFALLPKNCILRCNGFYLVLAFLGPGSTCSRAGFDRNDGPRLTRRRIRRSKERSCAAS